MSGLNGRIILFSAKIEVSEQMFNVEGKEFHMNVGSLAIQKCNFPHIFHIMTLDVRVGKLSTLQIMQD